MNNPIVCLTCDATMNLSDVLIDEHYEFLVCPCCGDRDAHFVPENPAPYFIEPCANERFGY